MKSKTMRHWVYRGTFAAALAFGLGMTMQSCEDDALTGQPSWLGNSIYERLEEEGNYQTTLRLIEDLGQRPVLSQTGSRTLFVADDEAYAKWFEENDWGVRSYEQLTLAQKKLLFNSAVVTNAYLVELLSNLSGTNPDKRMGNAMRRPSAVSIYDSVYTMKPEDMPVALGMKVTKFKDPWAKYRTKANGIVLMKDNTPAPMIHFLPAFMQNKKFKTEDLSLLTNGEATSLTEAWVNGKRIFERDITCKNGYIHKVDGVIEPNVNMAEYLRQQAKETDPNYSTAIWSRLIDHFAAPYYNEALTKEYNRLYQNEDSVFVLRYLSSRSVDGAANNRTPDNESVGELLPFDPGWNGYYPENATLHEDAAVMIVPSDAALQKWFDEGGGNALKKQYKEWDSIPHQTLVDLLGVNMIEDFYDNIPSKFNNVLDATTQLPLGIQPGNVVHSFMACNGVVYITDEVFAPKSFSSVAFPAQVREDIMQVIYKAFDKCEFLPYLNSMDSRYSLIMPTDSALQWYVEPSSYGLSQPTMLKFRFEKNALKAERWNCDIDEYGNITPKICILKDVAADVVENRFNDLIDQLIVVGDIESGNSYYKSKGGTMLHVEQTAGGLQIAGQWQLDHNMAIPVVESYNQANGKSYQVDVHMPLASTRSVYQTLSEHPEYSLFLGYINGGTADDKNSMLINKMGSDKYCAGYEKENKNVRLFDNYNYNVYVPTNDALQQYIDAGIVPTWEDYEEQDSISKATETATEAELKFAAMAKKVISERISNLVRFHLQDNSVAVDGVPVANAEYESMLVNPANKRFYPLTVSATANSLTIVDPLGGEFHVNTADEALYNNVCCEYWFKGNTVNSKIYMKSDALVHQIDGVMMNPEWVNKELWDNEKKVEFITWKDEVNNRLAATNQGGTN